MPSAADAGRPGLNAFAIDRGSCVPVDDAACASIAACIVLCLRKSNTSQCVATKAFSECERTSDWFLQGTACRRK